MAGEAALEGVRPRSPRRVVTRRRQRALVRAAQRGDAAALEALFRAHWPAAYRAAWFVVRDEQAAEDIAQEAFLAAVAALDRFDRRRPLAPWLRTIVARRAIDALRARRLRREVGDAALETVPAADDPAPPSGDLADALAGLPDDQRTAVVLRHVLELTPSEIAELLGVPRGTVNSRLRRGLDALEPWGERAR
ncbi:MAG TPA: RNA polymerase sigma factor [Solirubrobacteraceae bacterium]|nr:RNA polymerase sigma factor [Solirubrobacteraceae bacterium]